MNSLFSNTTLKIAGGLALALALTILTGCSNSESANSGGAKDPQDLSRLKEGPSPEDMKAMQAAAKGLGAPPAPPTSTTASENR